MNRWVRRALRLSNGNASFDAAAYWESRYASGGTSGDGSYGRLAEFKAATLNAFIREQGIASAVEFGCGDGRQLELIAYPTYVGFDVAPSAVRHCIERFAQDQTKSFFLYDPSCFQDRAERFRADVAVSLDVIYHITDDRTFERYMSQLCHAGRRFVLVYATNFDRPVTPHLRHRAFGKWIAAKRPEFRLIRQIPNPFPGVGEQESDASFWLFERARST